MCCCWCCCCCRHYCVVGIVVVVIVFFIIDRLNLPQHAWAIFPFRSICIANNFCFLCWLSHTNMIWFFLFFFSMCVCVYFFLLRIFLKSSTSLNITNKQTHTRAHTVFVQCNVVWWCTYMDFDAKKLPSISIWKSVRVCVFLSST